MAITTVRFMRECPQAVRKLYPNVHCNLVESCFKLGSFSCRIERYTDFLILGPIKFLTSLLKKALGVGRHRYLGFSASELAEGLTQIAVNDNNKKTVL